MSQDNVKPDGSKTAEAVKARPEKKKRFFSAAGSPATVLSFVVFALLLLSEELITGSYVNSSNPYLSTVIIQLCVFVVPCAFYCTLRRKNIVTDCRVNIKVVKPSALLCVLAGIPAVVLTVSAAKYVQCFAFGVRMSSAVSMSSAGDFAYLFLSLAIVPAIVEEFCFRGVILSEYERSYGKGAAIFVTSLVFAMMHFNARDFTAYLLSGLIIGVTVCVTDSVLSGMILHFASNIVSIYTDNMLVRISSDSSGGRLAFFVVLVLFLIFVMLWLYRIEVILKELTKKEEKQPSPVGKRMRFLPSETGFPQALLHIILTPAFGCVLIAFIIMISIQ